MQIDNNGIGSNSKATAKQKSTELKKDSNSAESPASTSSKDSVEISPEAQALKQLEVQIMAAPDVDSFKVEDIRQAIADGSYTINAEKAMSTALKMLQNNASY